MTKNDVISKVKQFKIILLLYLSIAMLYVYLTEAKKFSENNLIYIILIAIFGIFYFIYVYKITKILKYYGKTKINPVLMVIIHFLIPLSAFFIPFYLWIKSSDLISEILKPLGSFPEK